MPKLTYREGKRCMNALTAAGWTHIATLLKSSDSKSTCYGMCYTRNGERFWLNKDTFTDLPVAMPTEHELAVPTFQALAQNAYNTAISLTATPFTAQAYFDTAMICIEAAIVCQFGPYKR